MPKLSLLIPTYNRPKDIFRQLKYYSQEKADFDIVVADSSSEENKKQNRQAVLKFPNLKIQYIEYPEETNPYHKFADCIKYAKEKYAVFCGDDDFLMPQGVIKSAEFLESHSDFTVAHGYYFGFDLDGGFTWETRYHKESIEFPSPEERLFYFLSEYSLPTFYGVHRTDYLKNGFDEIINSGVNTVFFGEMLPGMLDVIRGKTKYLDIMYMARRVGARQDLRPSLADFMKEKNYPEEYSKFQECLIKRLSEKSGLSPEASKKVVDGAMEKYVRKYFALTPKRVLRNLAEKNKAFGTAYRSAKLLLGKKPAPKFDFKPEYQDEFDKIKSYIISNV